MAVVEKSIFIEMSPEELYDFGVNHPERIPEWFEGVETIEVDSTYPAVGGKVEVTYKAAGITFKTTGTAIEAVRGKKYATQYTGMATGVQTWTYQPEGSGTRLTLHFDYEIVGGGVGKMLDKLLIERQNAKNFEQSLKNLKVMAEG